MSTSDPEALSPSLVLFYELISTVDSADDVIAGIDFHEVENGIGVMFTLKDKKPEE